MATIDGKPVTITVDAACTGCGQCVKVCPCEYLELTDKRAAERRDPALGCITCAQCAAICPEEAIHVEAAGLVREDVFAFPGSRPASYDELLRLLAGRRSIRRFRDQPVSTEDVDKLLEAAQQAPAGLPPSNVRAVVVQGKAQVRDFAFDFLARVAKMGWLFSRWGVWLLRPGMSAREHREMREKIAPLYRGLIAGWRQGQDFMFYDAPLALVFVCEGDSVDAAIAATYAMAAAETLGLGSCMIGTVVPMLPMTGKEFRGRYGFPDYARHGIAVVFGYPQDKFRRAVRRRFAAVVRPAGKD
ncbi:MAG: 4Fe-4S dicluster domain-containing protein [Candidatus Omnitrophica bacterium]|nr:4Fe-4S dicluster domain-containing protein [Candidatus Omnitrophota bacterium]